MCGGDGAWRMALSNPVRQASHMLEDRCGVGPEGASSVAVGSTGDASAVGMLAVEGGAV